ncbi:MAG: UTP--glucose-1-phosphate uridylyltransferase GalU [Peptococcaceae bacterium]|jgi:UTP--glucose-1-phosphate uridylyltransferase|nr:UTP--glucose-1-phosphate uridylyltransferase GalU [Peptococcaceae bacterium]
MKIEKGVKIEETTKIEKGVKIKKAVIPAAGLGTRFLPATKAQPKEMLPLVDKPAIQYVVEEAVAAGVTDIIIVTGRGKRAIEDHFDKAYELETELERKGNIDSLDTVRRISAMADVYYVRQKESLGLGHAIYCARKFVGHEPFAVLLGDDIVIHDRQPAIGQLIGEYHLRETNIVAMMEVLPEQVSKYGILEAENPTQTGSRKVTNLVEKPSVQEAKSNLAIMGRYILMPEIFEILENLPRGYGGEIQLTDSLKALLLRQDIYAVPVVGRRYDIGDKLGYLIANLELAMDDPSLKSSLTPYLKELLQSLTL